jgi:hypothetical protein
MIVWGEYIPITSLSLGIICVVMRIMHFVAIEPDMAISTGTFVVHCTGLFTIVCDRADSQGALVIIPTAWALFASKSNPQPAP